MGVETIEQHMPSRLVDALMDALRDEFDGAEPVASTFHGEHNNDIAEIRFDDGRRLMIKRARADWAAERFESSRIAARLLRERAGVVAPDHLELPNDVDDRPIMTYWRIRLPTLKDVWPELSEAERAEVLRDWGRLARRVHAVELPGAGALPNAFAERPSIREYVEADLVGRLLPAVTGVWPAGVEFVEHLAALVPELIDAANEPTARLVHNDLHMDNILCDLSGETPRCVGLLDLEATAGSMPEMDLASTQVLHGPNFGNELYGDWFDQIRDGYDAPVDDERLGFFRAYHLANFGFYSALIGRDEHAATIVRMAEHAIGALRSSAFVGT